MKRLIISFSLVCLAISAAVAQPSVRIGNLEFSVRKSAQDTSYQISVITPDLPQPSTESQPEPVAPARRPSFTSYSKSSVIMGGGFIIPSSENRHLNTLSGNSINLDFGGIRRHHISRRFAIGGMYHYSFYNFRLDKASENPAFNTEVMGNMKFDDVDREIYRSHNFALGLFTRFYFIPPSNRRSNNGLFIDVGAQGDYAFSRFYWITALDGGRKFRDSSEHFSNPFSASAVARIGGIWLWKTNSSPALFLRYRFTDVFKQNVLPVDLPPITIGIHFYP